MGESVKASESESGMSQSEFHAAVRGVDDFLAKEQAERFAEQTRSAGSSGVDAPEPLRGGEAPGFTPRRRPGADVFGDVAVRVTCGLAVIGLVTVTTIVGAIFHSIWRVLTR